MTDSFPCEGEDRLNFNVRLRMDRVKYGNLEFKELPEGNLVIENIQTGIIETKTDVWVEGYYIPVKD
ncbi:MAG: hypothetical protein H0X29_04415 [Parachlamydiaceae bacterium]|nr:hypothetical protein [Parachlamydiaceae bacterium]